MTDINILFYQLIQVSLGTRICLSHTPSADEWGELYAMAKKQSLVGVCFAGVQKLAIQQQEPPEMLYLTWMGMAAKIQQRNEVVNRQCVELQNKFNSEGVPASILKGQGVAQLYSPDLSGLRQSGDIDVYVDLDYKEAYGLACRLAGNNVKFEYKHLPVSLFQDTEVELHYIPEILFNPWRMKRLKKWYKEVGCYCFVSSDCGFNTPLSQFNLVFILLHAYRHLVAGGIGLRQLMDYYFVLQTRKDDVMKSDIIETLRELGLLRFASGVMWIMKNKFGLDERLLLCEPDKREGGFILEEVMASGNFGHHDERFGKNSGSKLGFLKYLIRRNMHLLSHYPSEVLCVPLYFIWHFCWKRMNKPSVERYK